MIFILIIIIILTLSAALNILRYINMALAAKSLTIPAIYVV